MAHIGNHSDRQLDWNSLASKRPLPIQFSLYASQRVSKALCPALVVRVDGVEVVRILDPEHKEPFFSLEGIFVLAGLTIVEGLLRFDLRRDRGDYDLTLAGLEPREGIWASWKVARDVVERLDMLQLFASLFDCRHAWSLDEGADGITHNWRGTSDSFDADAYSLVSLLDMPLRNVQVLPRGQQLRTLLSSEQRQRIVSDGKPAFLLLGKESEQRQRRWRVEQRLLRWSVWTVESFREIKEELPVAYQAEQLAEEAHSDKPAVDSSDDEPFDIKNAEIILLLNDMLPRATGGTSFAIAEGPEISVISTSETFAQVLGSELDGHDSVRQARTSLLLIHQFNKLYVDQAVAVARHQLAVSLHQTSMAAMRLDQSPSDAQLAAILTSNDRIELSLRRLLRSRDDRNASRPEAVVTYEDRVVRTSFSWGFVLTIGVSSLLLNMAVWSLY